MINYDDVMEQIKNAEAKEYEESGAIAEEKAEQEEMDMIERRMTCCRDRVEALLKENIKSSTGIRHNVSSVH